MAFLAVVLITIFHFAPISPSLEADRISSLPDQPQVNFQQYAGYISVDETHQRQLFYYFVEAEVDPTSKPLVLWLNGGPGCSSVGTGAFSEHGPFKPSGNHLVRNQHSWNKAANMLYLESPAGVGFSFSRNKSFYSYVDDEMTARDNFVFLKQWLKRFNVYKNSHVYILGESYGGHYVPQLADLIIKSEAKINLKGIAIGNPLLEFNSDFNSKAEYMWSHGLISDATFHLYNTVCNYSQIRRQDMKGVYTPNCIHVLRQSYGEVGRVDFFDVTLDQCLPSVKSQSQALNQLKYSENIDVCVKNETDIYLNREDVRRALHAELVDVNVGRWNICSRVLHYNFDDVERPTIMLLGSFVKSGVRVLAYSGDQDSVIPFTATRSLIARLAKELGLNTTVSYRNWFDQKQVAGWTEAYGDHLSFATIRGAAHEAPFSQPQRSLVLFRSFVMGQPLPKSADVI